MRKYIVIYCVDIPKVEKIPGHAKLIFNYYKGEGYNKFLEVDKEEGFTGRWVYLSNPLYNYDKRYTTIGEIDCAVFYTKKSVAKILSKRIRLTDKKELPKAIGKHYLVPVYGLFDLFLVHMAIRFVLKNYYKFNIYGGWPFVWSAEKYKLKKKINS